MNFFAKLKRSVWLMSTAALGIGLIVAALIFFLLNDGAVPNTSDQDRPVKQTVEERKPMMPKPQVMKVTLDSEDIPIASFNAADFGALPDDDQDDTAAIQAALNAAYVNQGGVVFVPAGRYRVNGSLTVPAGVSIRGDWMNPDKGGLGKGTILMAYAGRGNAEEKPFLTTHNGATVRDLTIWYPEQNDPNHVQPYPYTIANDDKGYYGPNLFNLTLINSYQGVKIVANAGHYLRNVYGTVLNAGLYIDSIYNIGRLESIHLSPNYWAQSGLNRGVTTDAVKSYTYGNATGVLFFKSDWEYVYDVTLEGLKVGILFDQSRTGVFNGQIWGLRTEGGQTGLLLKKVSNIGVVISGSTIRASGKDGIALWAPDTFKDSSISVNSSFIGAPEGKPVLLEGRGMLNFNNTGFESWSEGGYAVTARAGSVVLTNNTFSSSQPAVYLDTNTSSASIWANRFSVQEPVVNQSKGDVKIDLSFSGGAQIPKLMDMGSPQADEMPQLGTYRKPATSKLYYVKDFGAKGDGLGDDTQAIQSALNEAERYGGGTVYIPPGRYRIQGHLTVGKNIELRGSWDGPHHFGVAPKGTVLLPFENQGNADGLPFITLEDYAGVRGFSVFYTDQAYDNIVKYPVTIEGQGLGNYAIDVTLPNSYVGIRLTQGDYYVNYAGGFGLKTFLLLDGAKEKGYVQNLMVGGGQWQDGQREANAPRPDWWKQHPSSYATALELKDSSNVEMFNNFSFGVGYGLVINGTSDHVHNFGLGIDNAERTITLTGSGQDLRFVNSQLVAIGGKEKRYIYTSPSFSGHVSFFNTLAWACETGSEFDGTGKVILQQYKAREGIVNQKGGTLWADSSFLTHAFPQVALLDGIQKAYLYANVGSNPAFGADHPERAEMKNNIRK